MFNTDILSKLKCPCYRAFIQSNKYLQTIIYSYKVRWLACDVAIRLKLRLLLYKKKLKKPEKWSITIKTKPCNIDKTIMHWRFSHKWLVHMISWQVRDTSNWILNKKQTAITEYTSTWPSSLTAKTTYRPCKKKADLCPFLASIYQLEHKTCHISKESISLSQFRN